MVRGRDKQRGRISATQVHRNRSRVLDGWEVLEDGPAAGDGLSVDGVWDIETRNWDEFVCGALWTSAGTEVFTDPDDLAERILGMKGATLWAHAGGVFDTLWLLDWCFSKGKPPEARVILSGSSVASCAFKGGPILRDSCRLMPMTLKACATMFGGGVEKQTLGLPCVCGDDCGGYCSIGPKMPARQWRRLEEYLEADIGALRDTLFGLMAYSERNNIKLAGTVAGSTWRTAKEWCGLPAADWTLPEYAYLRSAYYGGRVEVGRTRARKIWNYDRTQAYPAAMCKPLPMGDYESVGGRSASKAFNADRPGFYDAVVDVPESIAPPLPLRLKNRIAYPWGKVEGFWPRDELSHAVEVGAKVQKIRRAVVWDREEPILKSYMEHCFALREAAETKSLKTWLKFLANSFSGACATDPERDEIKIGDFSDDSRYEQVGRSPWVWRRGIYHISDRAHIHWAGTLTGDARVELARGIEHAGDDWCYSDTDSNKATRELTRNVGHGLGLWKFEGTATNYECLAPKVYSYMDEGKRFARAKGIREAEENWADIRGRKSVTSVGGVKSLLVAARGENMFERKETSRQLKPVTKWCGARLRDGDRTRAPHVSQLKELNK